MKCNDLSVNCNAMHRIASRQTFSAAAALAFA
jgi:hypothetical protein